MSYTMYTPLNVWLDPASVTDVVAYIQTYLSENTIYSETEIETIIHDYLIAHPELIGGVQSVNGETGTVVLTASDINTENNVSIESVLSSLSSQISSIASSVATNTTNITNLTGRMTTAETDLTNLKSSFNEATQYIYGTGTKEINYPDGTHYYLSTGRRFWNDEIAPGYIVTDVVIPVGNIGGGAFLTVSLWELQDDNNTLKQAVENTITPTANTDNTVVFNYSSDKPLYVSFISANAQVFYRTAQTGKKWLNTTDTASTELLKNQLTTFSNMSLVGKIKYKYNFLYNREFYSGWQTGNIVVFGDSTVDGSTTTNFSPNVIGTDRTADANPYVFTSVVETMLNTFTGGNTRVYNAGFASRTLGYIAEHYNDIMSAFSNVKSALLVIDANSANADRSVYESNIRTGLETLINLLQKDGIAPAVVSPQPMFYYPTDDTGLPAINSAGEFAIAVNIGKDICSKYHIPFINLGEITNKTMESPYLKTTDFYGDRIHFNDSGHKFEGYELFGELFHPIIYFEGNKILIPLDSNRCELSAVSGISATNVDGHRVILLLSDNTRTDVLARYYVISKVPFKVGGVEIAGWASYYDVYIDGVLYTSNTRDEGAELTAGTHEVTIKPTGTNHVVCFAGITLNV